MFKILEAELLAEKTYKMVVEAPNVAHACEPGQFLIVRCEEESERIALTICDYDREQETVTIVFQTIGESSYKIAEKKAGDSGVQVPPGVNAMNLESIGDKITIPCTVAYNKTFADIIDIVDTPINQNTNLQNALTVSTHIKEDGVYFDVYDLNFKKITIPYIDYLNSKVVASEYVDYDKMKLKPNDNNQVEVKYRMRRKMVDLSEIQLIDLHPDYRLSSMTRRLPFINSTDSVRLSMGTSMLKNLSSNIVICYVNLVKCWKPLKINYSRFGHL